jgi:hypothetical protein
MDGSLTMWAEIGLDLRRHGWGPSKVAAHLNVPRSTVRHWFNAGGTPLNQCGAQLISLHARIVCHQKDPKPVWQAANCL